MCNAEKTVIYIPKLSIGQYLILFDIIYYLKMPWFAANSRYKKELCFGKKTEF